MSYLSLLTPKDMIGLKQYLYMVGGLSSRGLWYCYIHHYFTVDRLLELSSIFELSKNRKGEIIINIKQEAYFGIMDELFLTASNSEYPFYVISDCKFTYDEFKAICSLYEPKGYPCIWRDEEYINEILEGKIYDFVKKRILEKGKFDGDLIDYYRLSSPFYDALKKYIETAYIPTDIYRSLM